MEEALRQQLAACVAAFETLTGTKPSSMSRKAVNDARFVDKVIAGEGFTVRTYDRVLQWLSDNWPAESGDQWPQGTPRPVQSVQSAEPEAVAS